MKTKRRIPTGEYSALLIKVVHFDPEQVELHPQLPTFRCVFRVEEGEYKNCKVNLNLKLEQSRFTFNQLQKSRELATKLCELSGTEDLDSCVGGLFKIFVSEFITQTITEDREVKETSFSYVADIFYT